ncbi:MAG: winged helix-turn-helix transcriptional regulator [Solirubrobacteraceae bacterium]
MHTILIADTNDQALSARAEGLLLDGYDVHIARTEPHTRFKLTTAAPDALVLGTLETAARSLKLLRALRAGEIARTEPRMPVIALGADTDTQAVRHYRTGADIALPAGASPLLLKGALDALAARTGSEQLRHRVLRAAGLVIDCHARAVTVHGVPVHLSRLEFDLLQTLARDPSRTFTKRELTRDIWGYDPAAAGPSRTIDSHASRLRQKLRAAGADPLIHSVRSVGYRLTHK